MKNTIGLSRRGFLAGSLAAGAWMRHAMGDAAGDDLPRVDLHVHLDNSTLEQVLELSKSLDVRFGIVQHAGTKENKYPVVLSNDEELAAWIASLEGKPVYKGVQVEWIDWMGCFSKEMLAKLDFVLGDAMTMHGKNGARQKMWEKEAEIGAPQAFMDRYVDWHVEVMTTTPIDIFANLTWLPDPLLPDYDTLWTEARMRKIIDTAVKCNVALEISGWLKLPRLPFLRMAKDAGAKFSFGTNGRYPKMGKIEHCLETAHALGLKRADIFVPPCPRRTIGAA
jgi:histidinol phosphatase-like PHP family hydrolase